MNIILLLILLITCKHYFNLAKRDNRLVNTILILLMVNTTLVISEHTIVSTSLLLLQVNTGL